MSKLPPYPDEIDPRTSLDVIREVHSILGWSAPSEMNERDAFQYLRELRHRLATPLCESITEHAMSLRTKQIEGQRE